MTATKSSAGEFSQVAAAPASKVHFMEPALKVNELCNKRRLSREEALKIEERSLKFRPGRASTIPVHLKKPLTSSQRPIHQTERRATDFSDFLPAERVMTMEDLAKNKQDRHEARPHVRAKEKAKKVAVKAAKFGGAFLGKRTE